MLEWKTPEIPRKYCGSILALQAACRRFESDYLHQPQVNLKHPIQRSKSGNQAIAALLRYVSEQVYLAADFSAIFVTRPPQVTMKKIETRKTT